MLENFYCSDFCIIHGLGGAIVNMVCESKHSKNHLGLINADLMLGETEPRGGVSSGLCLFHDWINICCFLFTENGTCPALVVLKWIRMNSADSSVNCTLGCLNGFYKFPPTMDKVKSTEEVSPH